MRLAFIKRQFSLYGGAERYLQTLIGELIKDGHEIHIFANQWVEGKRIIPHPINILPVGSFLSLLTFNRNIRKAVEKARDIDCIISFERTTCQDIYRAGDGCHAEWLKIRSENESIFKRASFKINPLHIYLLHLEKLLFTNTRIIVANSKMVRGQIIKHYQIPEERIMIIYNGVDLERFTPQNKLRWRRFVREDLGILEGEKLLLFVGTGFKRKGLGSVINAISLIKRGMNSTLKLLSIGKGDVRPYQDLAERKGLSGDVIFLNPQREIEKFYAAADLFILPTLYDPFSNATLEAMASGLPIITTRNNGAAELIKSGQEGYIIKDPLNEEELAEKIVASMKDLEHMGIKARSGAERFPIEKAAREFMGVINQVIGSKT